MPPAIRVENLGKRYRLAHGQDRAKYRTLRESLTDLVKAPFRPRTTTEEFWALNDVSFEVQPGEVVGIIGRNGAGKSTLLKVLSRITKPTTGRVEINGRVGSLLEVGTGFHPELTGRENIYLNGSILGMSRREIDRKFDEIVAFAEVEKFLDTPVKRYSSGMYVRLAFAVAAHLEPEILIVDEVLAVGDAAFQKKCTQRMGQVSQAGRTVLLVSHDLPMVQKLSSQAVWMNGGRIHQTGKPAEVVSAYQVHAVESSAKDADIDLTDHPNRTHGSNPLLRRLRLFNAAGEPAVTYPLGQGLTMVLDFRVLPGAFEMNVAVDICDPTGTPVSHVSTATHPSRGELPSGIESARCHIPSLMLSPGEYIFNVRIGDVEDWQDTVTDVARFSVLPSNYLGNGRCPLRRYGAAVTLADWVLGPASGFHYTDPRHPSDAVPARPGG